MPYKNALRHGVLDFDQSLQRCGRPFGFARA